MDEDREAITEPTTTAELRKRVAAEAERQAAALRAQYEAELRTRAALAALTGLCSQASLPADPGTLATQAVHYADALVTALIGGR